MSRSSKLTIALSLALAVAQAAPAQEASEQQTAPAEVKETHGAWQIRCSGDVCVMSQAGKANGKDVLEIQLRKLQGTKAPDGAVVPAAMQIVTPLGVVLPAGVRIKVDSKKERAAPYETCTQGGCVVRQPIGDDFVNELKAGAKAKVTIVAMPRAEIPVDISLSGFTKAYNALK